MLPVGNLWDESCKQRTRTQISNLIFFFFFVQSGYPFLWGRWWTGVQLWRRCLHWFWVWGTCLAFGFWLHLTHQIEAKCNMWMLWQIRHTWQKAEVGENWEAKGRFPWGMRVSVCLYINKTVCSDPACMWKLLGFFIAAENDKSSITFWVIIMEAFLALKKPQRRAPVIVLMWWNPKCP